MSDFCYISNLVDPNECIGNSLSTINFNFSALDTGLCQVSSIIMETPVLEIIRSAPDICFNALRRVVDEDVHIFGGMGPSSSTPISAWNSCFRKVPNIWATLSGTHFKFPQLAPSSDSDDLLNIAVFDSSNTLHSSSAINLFKNNLKIKDSSGTTIVSGPSALKFSGTVTATGKEAFINISSGLTLFDSPIYTYTNSNRTGTPGSANQTITKIDTHEFHANDLPGYNANYKFIYVHYRQDLKSGDGSYGGTLYTYINGMPFGYVQTQGGDFNSDTGYAFVKIPTDKKFTITRTTQSGLGFNASRGTSSPETFTSINIWGFGS
jgi:hypothetical protein